MKNKKILFMGKVYDTKTTALADIQTDIQARIKDYVKLDLPVYVKEITPTELSISILRGLKGEISSDVLPEVDMLLISGEGYQDYQPKYSLTGIAHFPGIDYSYGIDDYIDIYKKNIRAEKASRVKMIDIDAQKDFLSVRFCY